MINVEHLRKSFQGTEVLKDISVTINKGDVVCIIGPSGSGKSTLIKLLLRELVATEGSIHVMGYDLNKIRHRQIPPQSAMVQ